MFSVLLFQFLRPKGVIKDLKATNRQYEGYGQ